MTKREALRWHVELWTWLAEHPIKQKKDWPGWKEQEVKAVTDKSALAGTHCFACMYAEGAGLDCDYGECIIPLFRTGGHEQSSAILNVIGKPCTQDKSPYSIWCDRRGSRYKRTCAAKQIAASGEEALKRLEVEERKKASVS